MPTIQQIKQARNEAVAAINRVLLRAAQFGLENEQVEKLEQLKQDLENAVLDAILDSPELQAALAVMQVQAQHLKTVAQVMKDVTDFNTKIAGFVGQASGIASEVKKLTGVPV